MVPCYVFGLLGLYTSGPRLRCQEWFRVRTKHCQKRVEKVSTHGAGACLLEVLTHVFVFTHLIEIASQWFDSMPVYYATLNGTRQELPHLLGQARPPDVAFPGRHLGPNRDAGGHAATGASQAEAGLATACCTATDSMPTSDTSRLKPQRPVRPRAGGTLQDSSRTRCRNKPCASPFEGPPTPHCPCDVDRTSARASGGLAGTIILSRNVGCEGVLPNPSLGSSALARGVVTATLQCIICTTIRLSVPALRELRLEECSVHQGRSTPRNIKRSASARRAQ